MAYWNEMYTKRKQKEMLKKVIKKDNSPYPSYDMVPRTTTTSWQERARERRKERNFWIVGGVIIAIVVACGIFGILWVAQL